MNISTGYEPTYTWSEMQKQIYLAVKKEREACAEICDLFQARDVGMQPAECAGAIRARAQADGGEA